MQPGVYYQPQPSAGGMATAALILGVLAWTGIGIIGAIPGAILGKMELNAIERGESPAAGKQFAQIGYYLSLANLAFTALVMVLSCAIFAIYGFGMLAFVAAES
jgi:hypothetical protein